MPAECGIRRTPVGSSLPQTGGVRISGGEARGIRLRVPPGSRPAAERVRQAIFSSLADRVDGARVLDLYCGSGAYGLEALSRGAARAVLVDEDGRAVRAAGDNARAAGLEERSEIRRSDAGRYLEKRIRGDGPFDLVFCDPPYEARGAIAAVLEGAAAGVAPDALVVAESRWGEERPPSADGWVLEDDRRYGDTRVLVYRRPGSPDGASAGREDRKR